MDSDAVVVAASTAAHVEQVRACIEAGRHVLVEKPAAPDLRATVELRDAIARAGTASIVQVGHIEHFNPTVSALRRVLAGEVPLAVSGRRLGPPTRRGDGLDVVTDLMLHDVHVVVALGAGVLESASAIALGDPMQYAHATMCFGSGMVADLTASRITRARLRVLEATTADALVTADYVRGTVQVARWSDAHGDTVVEHAPVSTDEPLERELLAFVRAIQRGTVPEVDLDAAVRCMRIVDAIRCGTQLHPPGVATAEVARVSSAARPS